VFVGELSVGDPSRRQIIINNDAWDGYAAERSSILEAIRNSGTRNLIAVTGDHHRTSNFELDNVVRVEFMTPSVTSDRVLTHHRVCAAKRKGARRYMTQLKPLVQSPTGS